MTLALLLTAVTGAWAEDFLYLVVDGTSATMMYGAGKGDNPYYTIENGNGYWYVLAGPEPDTYYDKEKLTTVTIDASCKKYTGTTLRSLFDYWSKLTTINNLENLNTSAVTDMYRMFAVCQALTSLDLSCLNTASVTNMEEMFIGLTLETIDLSGWNTSSVTNMYCMFYSCSNLKNIYVGDGWSTASVTKGKLMFSGCPNLPGFDSGKVTHEMAKLVPDGYLSMKPEEIDVTWDPSTRTGTFQMPAYDVEIAPIYAPVAKWATKGDAVLTPTAIEGIYAGTTDDIVKAGTVATGQGKAMYFATTDAKMTAEKAATADGWLSILPTAAGYDDATTVYVWYYIAGADTPDGQEATDKNTFNNSEICATPIKVTVLSNKFDITFNAANANTIEAGKATVTVGGTAATVTEGKLEGVKMGSEVKMTAKDGYKFKKVEAKKKSVGPVLNLTNPAVGQLIGDDGKNYNNGAVPTGVTALAKICLISGDHGVALALKDFGFTTWNAVKEALETYEPKFTNATWDMPTEDEWNQMTDKAGGYGALRDSFTGVGGTDMSDSSYWSSTSVDANNAKNFSFYTGEWGSYGKNYDRYTRLRLAW